LEQQAQALFKSWFVDFEPIKDQPFIESELGMIPQGWKVIELQEYVLIKRGGSPRPIQNYISDHGYRWLKISDATSSSSPYIFNIKEKIKESGLSKTVYLKSGDLVLSNSATPGIPKILGVDTCIHDGWLYFPQSKLSMYFLYLFFKYKRAFLVSQGNGSVFTNLKTEIVKSLLVSIPSEDDLKAFDSIVMPIFDVISKNTKESRCLAELRDALLPRLMSGEINVDDIKI
jgi:type I restriction enzyme S subunit